MSIFLVILACVALALAIFLIYLLSQPAKYTVTHTADIEASADTVFEKIADLKTWSDWNPWILHEPEAELDFQANSEGFFNKEDSSYTWKGSYIGSGCMTHTKLHKSHRIEQKLEFFKPWKSTCQISFDIAAKPDSKKICSVTWNMQGRLPFLMRWMRSKLIRNCTRDYELGLLLLNGIMNPKSKQGIAFSIQGTVEESEQASLALGYKGALSKLGEAWSAAAPKIAAAIEAHPKLTQAGPPLTVYRRMNPKTEMLSCNIAFPIRSQDDSSISSEDIPEGFIYHIIPASTYSKSTLRGSYKYLKIAWFSSFAHLRMKKLRFLWKRAPLEKYLNMPQDSSENELLTEIYIPVAASCGKKST